MGGTAMRRASAAITMSLVLALSACGAGGSDGNEAKTPVSVDSGSEGSSSDDVATTVEAEEVDMPDLVGMTEDEARAAMADAGIDDQDIEVEEQESLEEAGTVVDQVPGADQPIAGSVTISVSTPVGPVPDFAGKQIADVKEWAEARGISVRETTVLDDTLGEGEVIRTTPKAGAKASSEIAVAVASKPIVGALTDVEPLATDRCYSVDTGEADVNGDFLQDSLLVVPYEDSDPCVIEYDFGRDWQQLKFTLGIQDDSPSDAKVRIEIFGDGKELLNTVVSFAETSDQKLDVTDVLRLKIQVTHLAGDDGQVTAVLGDLRRIGAPDEVPTTTTTTP